MTNNNNHGSSLHNSIPATSSSSSSRWQLRKFFHRTSSAGADIISTHLDDRQGDTEFFASLEETDHDLACLKRSEIKAGALLGKGTFTEIHAVTGIKLDPKVGAKHFVKRHELEAAVNHSNSNSQHSPQYALKHLSAQTLAKADAKTMARAARELVNDAKYLSRLSQHANIVTLRGITLDAFGHNYLAHQFDDFFLVIDRVSDWTLADRIYRDWRVQGGGMEPDEDLIPMKANYAFQIAKALRYCHSQGVLYRDLKPANVGFALHDPHCIQLLDFGLARDISIGTSSIDASSTSTSTGSSSASSSAASSPLSDDVPFRMTLAGTRRYLAGEVLTTGAYTWKSDTYSWAMTYYEMCTERKPYAGVTAEEHQLYVCQQGERPTVDDYYFPEAVDTILQKSWHPNVHQRWSMDQVCERMQTFLMKLDVTYYEQREGDFLFDLELPPQPQIETLDSEDMLVLDLEADVDGWMAQQQQGNVNRSSSSRRPSASSSRRPSANGASEDPEMKTSFKSVESTEENTSVAARRHSLTSTGEPRKRKIISEAA